MTQLILWTVILIATVLGFGAAFHIGRRRRAWWSIGAIIISALCLFAALVMTTGQLVELAGLN